MEANFFPDERRVFHELKTKGFEPAVVYDVGASTGIWSEIVAGVLPGAEYHLFEPLADHVYIFRADLRTRLPRMPNLRLHPVALGDSNGTAEMFVAQDAYGSSLMDRGDIPEVIDRTRVPQYRLDDYAAEKGLPAPDVIKIDCQGAEKMILSGGQKALENAKVLILETWLQRDYGPRTPLLCEIIEFLRTFSFSPVETGERFYDDKHRLYSIDVFFFAESLLERIWLSART